MQRTIDDDLNGVILYSRAVMLENWHKYKQALFHVLPPIIRDTAATVIRRHLQSELYEQGIGRHTESEVFDLGKSDLTSLSDFLGDKPFFMGEQPTIFGCDSIWFSCQCPLVPCGITLKRARETIGESLTILRSDEKALFCGGVGEEGILGKLPTVSHRPAVAAGTGRHCSAPLLMSLTSEILVGRRNVAFGVESGHSLKPPE